MAETHHTFCRICESLCGLEVTVDDGRISKIRPDDDHVATGGFACVKGLKQHQLYASPDRLLYPERRVGDRCERVSWGEAQGEIGAKVRQLIDRHGPDSIAMYVGTAAGFSVLHPVFAQGFMDGFGSTSMYASATQDCANKFAAAREIYGFPFTQPFPDVDRTECLIIVGANPVVSKWSFLQVADPTKRLREIAERGGRVVVVDPRRTETARVATDHVFIRPDTDVFFYLAFLHELLATGGVDRARVAEHMTGLAEVEALVAAWTPERAAEVTQIPAETLRELVAAYRSADGAALYSSTGVNMGTNGVLAFWIQEVINAVSGNLDRRGGTLVGEGIIDFARFGVRTGTLMADDRSRIGDFRKVNDAYPGGVLADEILTPGPGQVQALFVTGGNPLITMADAGRLREAFEQLELLVTLDIFRNETASLAHYVLPATDPFQRPDLPFIFPLMLGLQSRPYLQATGPSSSPTGSSATRPRSTSSWPRRAGSACSGRRARSGRSRRRRGGTRRSSGGSGPCAAVGARRGDAESPVAPDRPARVQEAAGASARVAPHRSRGALVPGRAGGDRRREGPPGARAAGRAGRLARCRLRPGPSRRRPADADHQAARQDPQLVDPQPRRHRLRRRGRHEPPLRAPRRRRPHRPGRGRLRRRVDRGGRRCGCR